MGLKAREKEEVVIPARGVKGLPGSEVETSGVHMNTVSVLSWRLPSWPACTLEALWGHAGARWKG